MNFQWQDVDQSAHVEVSDDDDAMDAKDADDRKDGDDVGIEDLAHAIDYEGTRMW